jgi:hypothetical protein
LKNYSPIIYIIYCFNDDENFIKIGRSVKTVKRRFTSKESMPYNYNVLKIIEGSPEFIFDYEHLLHRTYKKNKYNPLLYFNGSKKECFNTSILQDVLKH